jgi:NAD(P)H-hydrate epimerase
MDDPLIARLRSAGGEIFSIEQDASLAQLDAWLGRFAVLLDGVLGTGMRLPLQGKVAEVLEKVRQRERRGVKAGIQIVVAVDLPSGVDAESGAAAPETIPADLTVTMAAVKSGLLRFPACSLAGEVRVVGIGLTTQPTWLAVRRRVADAEMVRAVLPPRPPDAHKGTFGTTLVVAGSVNYTGAVLLAGKAAFRVGSGLLTLAIPAPLHAALAGHFVESTWLLLPHDMGVIAAEAADVLLENLERPTAMLLGPGFGLEDTTKEFLARLIGASPHSRRASMGFAVPSSKEAAVERAALPPLVIDADGLKLLGRIPHWQNYLPAPAVLTPHPGEMAILTGLSVAEIQANRLEIAERFATQWGHVVVLKGANTVVAAADGQTTIIPVATAALARAGTGDVLCGLIAGLRSQGVNAYQSAVAGCWIHAQAGLRAAALLGNTASVLAGDVLEAVTGVMSELK